MLIDVHMHIGRVGWPYSAPLTPARLVERLDEWGAEKGCVLPLSDTPEGAYLDSCTNEVIAACAEFPDRLIPFCLIDPRFGNNSPTTNFTPLLQEYKQRGCVALGELLPNLYIDDPLCINLYQHCARTEMPVLFDMKDAIGRPYAVVDDVGLPRLEKVLQACPDTVFIGHGPGFWADITGDRVIDLDNEYPTGPVVPGGGVPRLLERYPNLWADTSAGSGYNAFTRDAAFGYDFLERFQDKLLFATDICSPDSECRIVAYLKNAVAEHRLSRRAYEKIGWENAKRLLGI